MTQTAKHTPAVWWINPEQPCDVLGPNGLIARCASRNPAYDGQEFVDYARLIAAAPDTAAERDRLKELNEELLAVLDNIVANAKLISDPAMEGATDTYSVPLDDIDNARALIERIIKSMAA